MTFQKTWEKIVEPEKPIPLHDLELIVTEGDPFTLGAKRPALYEEVLRVLGQKTSGDGHCPRQGFGHSPDAAGWAQN